MTPEMIIDLVIAGTYGVYVLVAIIFLLAITYIVLKKNDKADNDG